jgi:short-subunit dehydrogenase
VTTRSTSGRDLHRRAKQCLRRHDLRRHRLVGGAGKDTMSAGADNYKIASREGVIGVAVSRGTGTDVLCTADRGDAVGSCRRAGAPLSGLSHDDGPRSEEGGRARRAPPSPRDNREGAPSGREPLRYKVVEGTLKGKAAVVTGASSGIGEAAARALSVRGAAVVLAARAEEKLRYLERDILAAGGRALAVKTDVSDESSVEALVERAVEEFGSLDILVNNAGLGLSGRVAELRVEDLRYLFEVNLLGPLRCVQAALPHMTRGGRIVNVSSVLGNRAIPKVGGYCATKFALNALSDALRVEIAERGVTVTSVYPGTTRTAFRDNSRRTKDEKRGWRPGGVTSERVAQKIVRAAEEGGRDVYVTLPDRLFVAGATLAPGLFDRLLRPWTRD